MSSTMTARHAAPSAPSFYQRHRRGVILTSIVLVLMLLATAAYAAWLVFANGNAFSRSGSAPVAPTIENITPVSLTTGQMMPGETGPLQVRVNNNANAFPLYLKAIDVLAANQAANNVYRASDGNDLGAICPTSNWTLQDKSGLSIEVPAGATTTLTIPNAVSFSANAPIGCADSVAKFSVNGNDQGFTFDIAP